MKKDRFLEAGKIINTHGVRGEVKIEVWADGPEFLCAFDTVYIGGKAVGLRSARVHGGFVIAALDGVGDVNAAMALKGKTVCIDRGDVKLPEGRVFIADILGARVVSDAGEELGVLEDIWERPANNVFVVKGQREILIPDAPEFILSLDAENGVVTVHLIEGM